MNHILHCILGWERKDSETGSAVADIVAAGIAAVAVVLHSRDNSLNWPQWCLRNKDIV